MSSLGFGFWGGFLPKYPGSCINAAGPEVTVADVVEGEEVDHNVSSPAAEFTLLTAKDGAAVNLWRLYPSLFRAPVNEIAEFFLARTVI